MPISPVFPYVPPNQPAPLRGGFDNQPYSVENEPLSTVLYTSTGTPESVMGLQFDSRGNLWRQELREKKKVGFITPQGRYKLNETGQEGDIFEARHPEREGLMDIDLANQDHPFINILHKTELQRALTGSESLYLRSLCNRSGLTGRGIKIGVLDPYESLDDEMEIKIVPTNVSTNPSIQPAKPSWAISEHSKAAGSIINDPVWGVAPGVQVVNAGFVPQQEQEISEVDDIRTLRSNFLQTAVGLFDDTTRQIYQVLQQKTPDLRVLSLTWGASFISTLVQLKEDINLRLENGSFVFPVARRQVLGPALYQGEAAQDQALLKFISQLYQHPAIQQARQRYIEATRQAVLRGVTIVAAAGNEHGQVARNVVLPGGAEMDELAKSPYVISVGASDTHQTPGYQADDSITPFSSYGDGRQYNPTIAAPGQNVYLNCQYETLSSTQIESGTSFAVPFVCGIIALMLQANPTLTFDQIKSILSKTAVYLPEYPREAQGAGVINPEGAIQLAFQMHPFRQPARQPANTQRLNGQIPNNLAPMFPVNG